MLKILLTPMVGGLKYLVRRIKMFELDIDDEEIEAVTRVLRSGWIVYGPEVQAFEREFAEYIGVKHALAVTSGTVALYCALKALGIGPGDEVIVPDFTFIATATSVLCAGARPVFADIELKTYNIDPDDVLEKITNRTKAIIAVHLYGHPADMKALREICEDKNLVLIEDAAQAHGAKYCNSYVGSLGDAAAFSFYATKNVATGEGGMVTTNRDDVCEKVKLLRDHGQVRKYYHVELGWNFMMTSIQAAIGRVQLKKLEKNIEVRRKNAEFLRSEISKIKWIRPPIELSTCRHAYHLFTVWIDDSAPLSRDKLVEYMRSKGVEVAVHYPLPLHQQPLFKSMGYRECCPNATEASKHVMSIPIHQKLSREDLEYIVNILRDVDEGRF